MTAPSVMFEGLDPFIPLEERTPVPVAELVPLPPGEPTADELEWYPLCSGCSRAWGPVRPTARLRLLRTRDTVLLLCDGCSDPPLTRQIVQPRVRGLEVRVAETG